MVNLHSIETQVLNVVPGMYSKRTVNNGLCFPIATIFKPVTALTTLIQIDRPHALFVHYQTTFLTIDADFQSKLLINHANAGSVVHSGNQRYKTATGFYMANLNPGVYK